MLRGPAAYHSRGWKMICQAAWPLKELLRGLQPPVVQDSRLPVLASFGVAATCEGCPRPLFGAMLLLRPRNADEDAVFLAYATLEFRASRGFVG